MINFKNLITRLQEDFDYYQHVIKQYDKVLFKTKNDTIVYIKLKKLIPKLHHFLYDVTKIEENEEEEFDFKELTDEYINKHKNEELTKAACRDYIAKSHIKWLFYDDFNHEIIKCKWTKDYLVEQINKYLDKRFGKGEIINEQRRH